MGAFDTPTRTQLEKHIFVAEKGDYYQLADGVAIGRFIDPPVWQRENRNILIILNLYK